MPIELIKKGVVPLDDPAQIDGVLDRKKPQDWLPLLHQIESACAKRGDEKALETIAQWRLSCQLAR
jgi:hypothetical protein